MSLALLGNRQIVDRRLRKATKEAIADHAIADTHTIQITVPDWAKPLREPSRYKAAWGGRSGGKSHYFAEALVERMVLDPNLQAVCIREIQKSLKFSAKLLIEKKIEALGMSHLFEVLTTEIRRKGGKGIIIFQGMQDHTADSIKSLEGFAIAWIEEAQNLSARSLQLLRPTIMRVSNSEIWATWNPEQPTDPIDHFFRGDDGAPKNSIVVSVNYDQNPFLNKDAKEEINLDLEGDPDTFNHVWLGGYNVKSQLQIFAGKWRLDEFEPEIDWDGPYYGADWGFANDPTAAVELWIKDRVLYVNRESWAVGLELDETAERWRRDIPGIEEYVVRADCSRPESISHVKRGSRDRPAIPFLTAADKWAGSVEEGIAYLLNFRQIVVHLRCVKYAEECRLYRYKSNAAGDPLPDILDKHNHCLAPNTLVETDRGAVRIDQIKPGTMVLTRKGYRKVLDAWVSDRNVKTYKVITSNGLDLIGTKKHQVFTDKGFKPIDALRYNDRVATLNYYSCRLPRKSNTRGLYSHDTQSPKEEQRGSIFSLCRRSGLGENIGCTGVYGPIAMALSKKGGMCTILTRILLTTQLRILSAFLHLFTCLNIPSVGMNRTGIEVCSTLPRFAHSRQHGIVSPKKVAHCIGGWVKNSRRRIARSLNVAATIAARAIRSTTYRFAGLSFAPMPASRHGAEKLGWTTFNVPACPVGHPSLLTNTAAPVAVAADVVAVLESRVLPEVWDLTVEGEHEFFANGILVHNCIDASRYALAPLIRASKQSSGMDLLRAIANG